MPLRTLTSLLALLVLAGARPDVAVPAVFSQEAASAAPRPPPTLTYGPLNFGLQLGAWFDQTQAVAYGAIRNGNTLAVRYCDYLVGNFEFVGVRARRSPGDEWRRIPRRRAQLEAYLSAGPSAYNIRWLKAGRIMPPGPYGEIGRYAKPSQLKHTFEVHLTSFVFPEDWTGAAEARIVQAMLDDSVNGDGRGNRNLESMPFAITLPFTPPQ